MKQAYTLPINLAKPARRALAQAGIATLGQLSSVSKAELSNLHGIGPQAVQQIEKALINSGLCFAGAIK